MSLRFLDADAVQRVQNLELQARTIVEGLLAGRHRSPFHGNSVEFAEHREYAVGDEPRFIDWKVWAKTNKLYIKQFEDETNLAATFLLDVSESMDYGAGAAHKLDYARTLVATLMYVLLRQSDSAGLIAFDETVRSQVPHRNSRRHLRDLLAAMDEPPTAGATDLEGVLRRAAEMHNRPGLMVLVSDLLSDRDAVARGLKLLRSRRHDVIVFHLLHDDEIDFGFDGLTRFEGLERLPTLTCDPRGLRSDYLRALADYRAEILKLCSRTGIDYRFVRTSQPVDATVAELLHERLRG